jgi:hypothetical protein
VGWKFVGITVVGRHDGVNEVSAQLGAKEGRTNGDRVGLNEGSEEGKNISDAHGTNDGCKDGK